MKTPPRPTSMATPRAGVRREVVLASWGDLPQRVVVLPSMPPTAARAALKERAPEEIPQGKAAARRRYFERQRGLPDDTQARPPARQRARRSGAGELLRAAAVLPA